MKRSVIEIEDMEHLSPMFKGDKGHRLAKLVMKIFAIDQVNALYERCCEHSGSDFANMALKDLGVDYLIGHLERLLPLREGPFITVSNHPYGGIDGVMLVDLMAGIRSDYKLMANQMLAMVKTMEENFISVKPKVGNEAMKPTTANLNGIRETLTRLRDGHPVGFFPAGAVSMFKFKNLRVMDREWQESIIKLIQAAKVPIVPIRFFDQNSSLFYFLELINWRIRLIRMPRELFNKNGNLTRLAIGNIVTVEEQAKFPDAHQLGEHLRKIIYDMPLPDTFVLRSRLRIPGKDAEKKVALG
ncbi:MAG TPA: 1-acyl-sn-glycerol-3-phosphate acyltransferase [Prolixibacteraceae bacterium]|nr:1-acyl-sn-glycerol-3-phosphate acyltransferase [Prolixibacteraceae bacterium]HPS12158.1 1-acyl-sn-glycerol-3-phosphate acyltransferase [Prolixibacteraceae bacterium]